MLKNIPRPGFYRIEGPRGDTRCVERVHLEDVEGLPLSSCLHLIVQGWAKHARGDKDGGPDCLDQADLMTPPGTVDLILGMIRVGQLPVPGPDTMAEWDPARTFYGLVVSDNCNSLRTREGSP